MADIRAFISSNLLAPLKQYPTVIQDTMIEIITQRLQQLYDYTLKFPEILTPNQNRIDILRAIADQFLFSVREEADIQEQIDILENILYVYRKRGSIDTIENMWKYYGGDLPRDVKVVIPSYNLFRYSLSKLSGSHVYPDSTRNRTGVYEIKLTNSNYPVPDLKEFMLNELVAAGNFIYFSNSIHMDVTDSDDSTSSAFKYDIIKEDNLINLQIYAIRSSRGFTWSGLNRLSSQRGRSLWSGKPEIFLELTNMIDLPIIPLTHHTYMDLGFVLDMARKVGEAEINYSIATIDSNMMIITHKLYCTPTDNSLDIDRHIYNMQGELLDSTYPGYFILGKTLLGEVIV